MSTATAPRAIFATVNGVRTVFPSGDKYLIGGWQERDIELHATEYLRADAAPSRSDIIQEALNEIEYLRDRISHPNGRRAAHIDSMDQQRVDALNEAWDAISALANQPEAAR